MSNSDTPDIVGINKVSKRLRKINKKMRSMKREADRALKYLDKQNQLQQQFEEELELEQAWEPGGMDA